MAFYATSKRPWEINVIGSADAKLSLPDMLPDGLAQSIHIQFNFKFPREYESLATTAYIQVGLFDISQSQQKMAILFQAVHQMGCGIDVLCQRLAEVPVKRDVEICWSDYGDAIEWETRKTVLQPFSRLRKSCSFRLAKVLGWQDGST